MIQTITLFTAKILHHPIAQSMNKTEMIYKKRSAMLRLDKNPSILVNAIDNKNAFLNKSLKIFILKIS